MFIIALRMATIMLFLPPRTLEATQLFFLRADERENQNRSGDILVLREEWQLVHTNATTTAHSATYIYEYQPHLPQGIWGTHRYVPFGYSTKGEGAGVPLRLASFKLGSGAKNIDLLRTRAHHKYRRPCARQQCKEQAVSAGREDCTTDDGSVLLSRGDWGNPITERMSTDEESRSDPFVGFYCITQFKPN